MNRTLLKQTILPGLLSGTVFVILTIVFVRFFETLPTEGTSLGIDNIFSALDDWDIHYAVTDGLRNPPWSVLPLVPVASLMSSRSAWGVLAFVTVAIGVLSVPNIQNRALYVICVVIAVMSHPALRNLADANLEGLVIAGVLLLLAGYSRKSPIVLALGFLLATIKPQSTWLLVIATAVYVLQRWPAHRWAVVLAICAAVIVPTMLWRGANWLDAVAGTWQAGSIMDISLSAALNRLGVVPSHLITVARFAILLITLAVVWRSNRDLSREKAGLLICGSMLIAPYVAGNSLATVLAVALVPVFIASPLVGGVLIMMVNLQFLLPHQVLYDYSAYWATLILLLSWGTFAVRVCCLKSIQAQN